MALAIIAENSPAIQKSYSRPRLRMLLGSKTFFKFLCSLYIVVGKGGKRFAALESDARNKVAAQISKIRTQAKRLQAEGKSAVDNAKREVENIILQTANTGKTR